MNRQAERAKTKLNEAGFELVSSFVVHGGMATSFDGTREVPETDAAYLWVREDDERGILAFRGSDTQEDLANVRDPRMIDMYGHKVHAGVADGEFTPLVDKMWAGDFQDLQTFVVTGHSLGGGCASLFAVLMNDPADPLRFGEDRKRVDELYGFGATPVFHNDEPVTTRTNTTLLIGRAVVFMYI